ncbi:SigB/SigF/SigG family RNA polymerase sigma factor [Catenuloplanes sp. NPDC051500]|uniref:SigB/SigF/SigG family RNA polymerase sigma factor n=1 Tax=Catenuloplanes sp. NPDC051500 TaxID=3363959 RepID=UPI00378B7C9C
MTPPERRHRAAELLATLSDLPQRHPDRARVRAEVIEAWLPLAHHLANRFAGRGETREDLDQVATVGLIKAVNRYDPGRGVPFSAFAIPTIAGEIKRHFRDRCWDVRVPRRLQELRAATSDASATLTHRLGRSPTVAELAAHLDRGEEEILEALEASQAYHAVSLSAPAGEGGAELGDLLGTEDEELAAAELRVALGPALADLDPREQRILTLRFYGNLTQSQIADRVGISQMHVSRLLARALTTLRGQLGDAL